MADQEVIIITGSNIGLGFLAAKLLSDKPYQIILTSRTLQKAKDAAEKLQTSASKAKFIPYELDVSSPASIVAFGEQIRAAHDHVDVLVNNAGINNDPNDAIPDEDVSLEGTQKRFDLASAVFATNVIGADALTYQILPLLRKSKAPRLIFTTSGMGSIALNLDPSHEWYAAGSYVYRASKAALNMTMVNWYKRLNTQGISVWAVCPGWNATGFAGLDPEQAKQWGAMEPEVGAGIIADVVLGKRKGEEGKMVHAEGVVWPW